MTTKKQIKCKKCEELIEMNKVHICDFNRKPIYCNLCNCGEEAQVCKWCYSRARRGYTKLEIRQKVENLKKEIIEETNTFKYDPNRNYYFRKIDEQFKELIE